MIKNLALATTAVLMAASPLAYAAETSAGTVGMTRPSAADLKSLTDARVAMVKAALQLTSDQEKYWPAIEDAMRARAKNRQARWERVAELRDSGPMEALHDRNPVELMQRRAEALSQRAADLKKVENELLYMPTNLARGIEVSDDPLINTRTEAYAESFGRRTAK